MRSIRQNRVAEHIRQILSDVFLFEMNDPRLAGLTVTEVKIDRELQFANVYVGALGDDEREDEVVAALERATGFLRRHVAQRLRTRTTPQLIFHWDPRIAEAQKMDELLDSLDIPEEVEELEDGGGS